MKRPLRLLAALLFVGAASCDTQPLLPEYALIETDTLLDCGAVRCRVQYRFTSIANADASPALRAIEQSSIRRFYELDDDFAGTAREAARTAIGRLAAELQRDADAMRRTAEKQGRALPDVVFEYAESVESELAVVDSVVVSTITSSGYRGGAHGHYATNVRNYSLADGYELTLADLFTPGQIEGIDSLIRVRLRERYGATDDNGLAEQGFFPEYIAPSEHFALTPEGITFYYNPYDIGCYALGDIRVGLGREELQRLGNGK